MRTAHALTVSPSMFYTGGGGPTPFWGSPPFGGGWSGGSPPGGCLVWGVPDPGGGAWSWGVISQHALRQTPPH